MAAVSRAAGTGRVDAPDHDDDDDVDDSTLVNLHVISLNKSPTSTTCINHQGYVMVTVDLYSTS